MPLPPAYTEDTLASFMRTELGDVGVLLGWDVAQTGGAPQVEEAIIDTLLLLGASELSDTLDLGLTRAAARLAIWQAARKSCAARYDERLENGQQFTRSQLLKAIDDQLIMAQADYEAAQAAMGGASPSETIRRDTLVYPTADPYAYYPPQWRRLPQGGGEWATQPVSPP